MFTRDNLQLFNGTTTLFVDPIRNSQSIISCQQHLLYMCIFSAKTYMIVLTHDSESLLAKDP